MREWGGGGAAAQCGYAKRCNNDSSREEAAKWRGGEEVELWKKKKRWKKEGLGTGSERQAVGLCSPSNIVEHQ